MKNLLSTLFTFIALQITAQSISTAGGLTASQLANILAGPNIVVTNASLTGAAVASGQFNQNGSNFLLNSGVILSTGNINTAVGPNNAAGGGNNAGTNLGSAGTAEMTALGGQNSFEAITLEFDFEVQSTSISFNYIFASEEYPEYAPPNSTGFNDVFAFYISGPGITGQENIALIPGTSNVVSINNINPVTNNQLYVNNTGGTAVQYDGFTTPLSATKTGLQPCQIYHLRLVIADIGDRFYNSSVFLQENSLVQGEVVDGTTQTVNSDGIALEGCIKGHFDFNLTAALTYDVTINYTIGGTAINGVDYQNIDNFITIPAGDTSGSIFIDAISEGITEGQETITITFQPSICAPSQTITLLINDAQPIAFSLAGTNLDCNADQSGEIAINATGGFPNYTYVVTDPNGIVTNSQTTPITGLAAGEYTVQVQDIYGCRAQALVIGGAFNAGTTFLPDGSGVTYESPLVISGFNAGQTITNVNQIQQICVNMEHSYSGDLLISIQSPSGQTVSLKGNGGGSTDLGEPIATGPVDGNSANTSPGVGYSYCFDATPFYSTMVNEANNFNRNYTDGQGNSYNDNYLPAGSYTSQQNFSALIGSPMNGTWKILVTDQFSLDNGYIFSWDISLVGDLPDSTVLLTEPLPITVSAVTTNTTCGTSNGAINCTVYNGVAPITYLWNTGATTEDLIGVAAGVYTLTATGSNGCSVSQTFTVNNTGTLAMQNQIAPVSCNGGSDGSVSIIPSGGLAPYAITWSNGATTSTISNLIAGTYTATITDQNGCQYSESFVVGQNNALQISLNSLSNELCNTNNGSIDISAIGGNGSYGYSWSNSATTQDLSNISAGTYQLVVTDGLGCTVNSSYTVSNNLTGCSNICYIDIQTNQVTASTCGNSNGAINVSVLNAVAPIQIVWSNGATTEDISGLAAGNYTVTVTDANNCSDSQSFTVTNNSGNLAVSNIQLTNESCGYSNGSILLSVSGGTNPYTYSWTNGSITEDISNLAAGTYTLTATDANGCSTSSTQTIANNSGTLQVSGNATSTACNQSSGSIDQTIIQSNGSVSYLWNTGATSADLVNLSSGNYSCSITDASGCTITNSYVVSTSTSGITIQNSLITNESCNNNLGAINLTVDGIGLSYLWSNGATTEDISGLSSGNYTCTITNSQGCTESTNQLSVINTAGNLLVQNTAITNASCGASNGSINISVSGGAPAYSYAWNNGATTQDITTLSAGNYTVLVSDANGCSTSHSVVLNNSSGGLTISNSLITNENCSGGIPSNGQGAIDISVAGATSPYTYSWTTGATTQDITNLTAGNYVVSVTAANGCALQQTFSVASNGSNLAITGATISDVTCGSSTGSINIQLTANSGPHSFVWSNGATTEDISSLTAGNYSVTVGNTFGCQVSQQYTIQNGSGTLSLSSAITNESCGNQNGTVNLTPAGGSLPLTYSWSNGSTTQDLTLLSAGNYQVQVTDFYGCLATSTSTVSNNANGLGIVFTTVTPDQCGQGIGAIDAMFTGTPVTINWSSGQTTEDISNLVAGIYSVTLTDVNGCSTTSSATISNQTGTLAVAFQNIQQETCSNSQGFIDIEMSGSAPFTYLWSNGALTQDLVNISSGTYTVIFTDALGCELSQSFQIQNNTASSITANAIITNTTCNSNNGSIDVSMTGGVGPFSYLWSTGSTAQDVFSLNDQTYTLTINDVSGCSVSYSYTLINTNTSSITVVDIQPDFCLFGNGYIEIQNDPNIIDYLIDGFSNFSPQFFNVSGGIHEITIVDAFGCTTSSMITVPNQTTYSTSAVIVNAGCGIGGSIDVSVDGQGEVGTFDYSWDSGQITQDISNLASGNYTLQTTFNSANGVCFGTETYTVLDEPIVTVSGTFVNDFCSTGSGSINQTVNSTSAVNFLWNTGATTEDISNLSAGTYTCSVSAVGSCVETYTYTISNTTSGIAINGIVDMDYCTNMNGAINATVSGATGAVTYQWSSGELTEDIVNISAGVYTLTAVDLNDNCSVSETFTVVNSDFDLVSSAVLVHATCMTCANGSVNLTASSSETMSFLWSNGATTEDVSNLLPGSYSVVISTPLGCDSTLTIEILSTFGVEENQQNSLVSIYPNPAVSQVTIDYTIPVTGSVEFTLTDVFGKLVFETKQSNSNQLIIDVNALSSGVYYLRIKSEIGTQTKQIQINRQN